MAGLALAPGLDLPPDLVTQAVAIVARRGAGKTYTGAVLTEELVSAGLPVVVLDPLGVWYGCARARTAGRTASR
jgi:DNA helicase HerA-like ATPase